MPSYACAICEYIYHPNRGDATKGIPPGTSFEDLPDDWVCPVCGAGKVVFAETSKGY
ncbi:MAG: rubredoxin [Bacteroidales bacterium]